MRLRKSVVVGTVAALAILGVTGSAQAKDGDRRGNDRAEVVEVEDDCDPATFTGQGIPCVGDGDTTFDEFLDEFLDEGEVDDWEFDPDDTEVDTGERVKAVNEGGEFHTFTRVREFGDACVEELNLGREPVIAECQDPEVAGALFGLTGLEPRDELLVTSADTGPAGFSQGLQPGDNLFQCLIHPWMRAVITVERDNRGHDDEHEDHSGHH
jgi:plastocyanin